MLLLFESSSQLPLSPACCPEPLARSQSHWLRIDSSHFTLLTDADLGKGREVIFRFEQMRGEFAQLLYKSRLNMSEPIDIIALNGD